MNVIIYVFAIIGFVVVAVLVIGFVISLKPEEYSSGADGDWERYRDSCMGTSDEKNDRPMKRK